MVSKRKIRVGILSGGRSAEHEVSLQSARNVFEAINKKKYDVVLIGIDKSGTWHLNESSHFLLNARNPKLIALNVSSDPVALASLKESGTLVRLTDKHDVGALDVVFPVLHGPFGEDGTVQGLLKLANVPFVGPSVLGSAVCMDKDVTKRLLRDAGIPIAEFVSVSKGERVAFGVLEKKLGLPMFVKPANLGSSVGVTKIHTKEEFRRALDNGFQYDNKLLVEEYVKGREIECSVLGNERPIASLPGEVVPSHGHEFYTYEAKYIDEHGALLSIPAKLSKHLVKNAQQLAVQTFQVLCCEGMARVDMFLRPNSELVINEVNTIPGFTNISMYPKLWEASGISYSKLIDRLIELAIERFHRDQKLKTSV